MVIWITGISGTGKTTLAQNLFKTLKKNIIQLFILMEINLDRFLKMILVIHLRTGTKMQLD